MGYHNTFLKIACPLCGRETDSTDLKYTDYSNNGLGYYECYNATAAHLSA